MLRLVEPEETTVTPVPLTTTASPTEKWPDAVAYQEAIQHPDSCLDDPRFYGASVAQNRRGLPLAYTGRFAVVFRLTATDNTRWALRCFTSTPEEEVIRSHRYISLAPHLTNRQIADLFVPFEYRHHGIKVGRTAYPALTMGWAEGEPIGNWVEKNRHNPSALLTLAATLADVLARLTAAGIAHGDWQHDNILVAEGGRRVTLVDYDGMYIPELANIPPSERGHPNYQNPNRVSRDYGPELDRFSCLLIQTALVALAVEPTLWDSFCDGDALVFHQNDLEDPARSDAFMTVRFIAETEKELGPLLHALEEACWTGSIPGTVPRAIFDSIAARRGVVVQKSMRPVTTVESTTVITGQDEEQTNTPLITIGKEAEIAPIITAGKQWFDAISGILRRQKVREWVHRIGTLLFFLTMVAFWVLLSLTHGNSEAFGAGFLSFFLLPAGIAIAYFLWPRNLDGIEVTELIRRNIEEVELNRYELERVGITLHELNRNPANLSAVAFVANALKSINLKMAGQGLNLSSDEWAVLHERHIWALGDISTQSIAGMSGAAREQLMSLRQSAMQDARNAYEQVAHTRRALQREYEALESERQGLLNVNDELNDRLSKMGDENLLEFVSSLFGL